jgi:hypothetical protein
LPLLSPVVLATTLQPWHTAFRTWKCAAIGASICLSKSAPFVRCGMYNGPSITVHGSAMAHENFLNRRQPLAPVRATAACMRHLVLLQALLQARLQ